MDDMPLDALLAQALDDVENLEEHHRYAQQSELIFKRLDYVLTLLTQLRRNIVSLRKIINRVHQTLPDRAPDKIWHRTVAEVQQVAVRSVAQLREAIYDGEISLLTLVSDLSATNAAVCERQVQIRDCLDSYKSLKSGSRTRPRARRAQGESV